MVVGVWKIVVRVDAGDFDQYGTDDVEILMRLVAGSLSGDQPPKVTIKSEQGWEWFPETSPLWIRDSNASHVYKIVTGDLSGNVDIMIPFLPADSQFVFDTITNTFQDAQEFEDALKLVPIPLPSTAPGFGQIVVDSGDSNKLKYVNPAGVAFDLTAAAGVGAPTNATYLTVTTNGTLTQERTLSPGDGIGYTDGGAGGAFTPYIDVINLAKRRITFIDDFFGEAATEGAGIFRSTRSGTGADVINVAATETGVFGIWQLSTGTTVSGRAGLKAGDTNSFCLGQGIAILEFKIKIPALSTAIEEFIVRCGFGDNSTTTVTDGLIFIYDRAVSAFWQMQNKNNTVTTQNISANTVAAGWVRLKVVVNANATSVSYYINDVEVSGSPSTLNIPSGTSRMLTAILSITKSVGSSNRTCEVDYAAMDIKLTSPR